MSTPTVAGLVAALNQVPLLEPGQLEELNRDLARRFPEPVELCRELVRRGWVTRYQLEQLFHGRGAQLVLGQYVLLDLLGAGGMGQVFKARHRRLDRIDALKVIRPECLAQPEALRRFLREARAAARLSHPNIVSVYDADEAGGTHFLALEYVEGTDLARLVREGKPLPIALACEYVRQASLGLQHAHEKGLVHRDIKPANLLLTADGKTVKILDLGLARLHDFDENRHSGSELTRTGTVMGTPDYMAPEQALDSHQVDIRADVYSLGCTLYFLLSGRPPFAQGSLTQKLLWHQQRDPEPLENLRPDLPAALAEVVRRLLAKKPEDRYATPLEVAHALEPFTRSEADFSFSGSAATIDHVPAQPVDRMDFSFAQSGVIAGFSPTEASLTENTVDIPRAPAGERTSLHAPPAPSPATWEGRTAVEPPPVELEPVEVVPTAKKPRGPEDADTVKARATGRKRKRRDLAEEEEEEEEAGGINWYTVVGVIGFLITAVILSWPYLRSLFGSAASDPAGQVGPRNPAPSGHHVGEVRVFRDHKDMVFGVAFSPDGKRAASASRDQSVRIWDLQDERKNAVLDNLPGAMLTVGWAGPERVVAGGTNSTLRIWDLGAGELPPRQKLHNGAIMSLAVAPDGRHVLSGGGTKTSLDFDVRWWELDTGTVIHTLKGHTAPVMRLAIAPDGKQAASCDQGGTLIRWDLETGKEEKGVPAVKEDRGPPPVNVRPTCVTWSGPNPDRLLVGYDDGVLRLWDLGTLADIGHFAGHEKDVLCVAVSADNKYALSGGGDKTVRLWDVATRTELRCFREHTDMVTGVAFSPDGKRAISCSQDNTVRLWQLP
jgi:serine/threonine-protein kinase